jgi:CheY-like chemotaxis protein
LIDLAAWIFPGTIPVGVLLSRVKIEQTGPCNVRTHLQPSFSDNDNARSGPTESMIPMNDNKPAPQATVLVVDNEPLVMLGTVVMLRELGYTVTSTELADQALAQFESDDAPAILVTDYAMPKMTGVHLAEAVLRLKPETRVLLVTGHENIGETTPSDWQFLSKPFSCAELRGALTRLETR